MKFVNGETRDSEGLGACWANVASSALDSVPACHHSLDKVAEQGFFVGQGR